jgi:hypothetical protein
MAMLNDGPLQLPLLFPCVCLAAFIEVRFSRLTQAPFLWAQSLYILGKLITEGLLSVGEIDPLNRRHTIAYTSNLGNDEGDMVRSRRVSAD